MARVKQNSEDALEKPQIPQEWRDHLSRAGKIGGSVKSKRKKASSRANLVAAFEKRWPGRPLPPGLLKIATPKHD